MPDPDVHPELAAAKSFHGHLGPYLVIGMRMGRVITGAFGEEPFSYRIFTSVGWQPPPSCVIDGLQITTPCTMGNSMIRVESSGEVKAWADKDGERLELMLKADVRERIDKETNRENEEAIAREFWEETPDALFEIKRYSP